MYVRVLFDRGFVFFFKQKTAYEMRISDWSSDVCSSDLELVSDLSNAEEVSHRVRIREGSHLARRPLAALELPIQTGLRVVAIRRDRNWITDVDGDAICVPGDVIFLRGSPAGIPRLRELAAAPHWEPPVPPEDGTLSDLDRAVEDRKSVG